MKFSTQSVIAVFVAAIICSLAVSPAFAAKYADPTLAVYEPGTLSAHSTVLEFRDGYQETFPADKNITLLMLNGSFVADAEIIIENNRSLVPIRVVSEKLNSVVDWNMENRVVTITTPGGRWVKLKIGVTQAETDSGTIALDVEPTIRNSKTYVPLRLVADALNCQVDYHADFFGRGLSAIIIEEHYGYDPFYWESEALSILKDLSKEMYKEASEITIINSGDSIPAQRDYDSQAITLTGRMGRYYIFTLEKFEQYPILFDMYGGDVYSLKAGLPYLFIDEGFINISWMYQ